MAYMIYGAVPREESTEEVRYNLPGSRLPAEYFSEYSPPKVALTTVPRALVARLNGLYR